MEETIKGYLKKVLTPQQKMGLKNFLSKFYSSDLNKLATIQGTDKWGRHWYTQHYDSHFRHLRKRRLNILEIGVGEYDRPDQGGHSLRMWKHYFPHSMIYSIDIYDKSLLQEKRIKIFQGSQVDENFLKDIFKQIGSLDIIIDDGSHLNEHVVTTFKILFPLLADGGIYAVEDVQTSYWPDHGGDSEDLNNPATMMNFFKGLTDGLNHVEFLKQGYEPSYFDKNIVAIHFYHNLIFINKGHNNEGSTREFF